MSQIPGVGVPTGSQHIRVADASLHVVTAGEGSPVVLLHGWPHTWQVWSPLMATLATEHTVVAVDLRGTGDSERVATGYDAATVAGDVLAVLHGLGLTSASVVALDASVPAAFLLAMEHAERLDRLVLMESVLPALPGAESFLRAGPPWWFGFHAVPGLAETVLVGHEADYLDWFYRSGTFAGRGIDPSTRAAFVAAYSGAESLRCGFEYYRAMPTNAAQITAATRDGARLTVPTMAIGGNSVGGALHRQLDAIADDLVGHVIPDCGHIVPLDRPDALLDLLTPFLACRAQ